MKRLCMAALCGATLALAGTVMQQVLRNPLASPTTLGVASGAQLALVVATILIPFQVVMIPLYLLMVQIGLRNSLWALILPQAATAFGIAPIENRETRLQSDGSPVAPEQHIGHGMEGALGGYPMSRDGSGTSWRPDAAPHAMSGNAFGESAAAGTG